jgi:hypothetical protein
MFGKGFCSTGVEPDKADELFLDIGLALAGQFGVASGQMFMKGAEKGCEEGYKLFHGRAEDLDNTSE